MQSTATWMDLGIIILSEVKSERERQISYDITYIWNLKCDTNELTTKQTHRHGRETYGYQRGREWEV